MLTHVIFCPSCMYIFGSLSLSSSLDFIPLPKLTDTFLHTEYFLYQLFFFFYWIEIKKKKEGQHWVLKLYWLVRNYFKKYIDTLRQVTPNKVWKKVEINSSIEWDKVLEKNVTKRKSNVFKDKWMYGLMLCMLLSNRQ